MQKHTVNISGPREVTLWREPEKPSAEKKKKSDKPLNHDLTMACVCWGGFSSVELAHELLKRERVVKVRINSRTETVEIEK